MKALYLRPVLVLALLVSAHVAVNYSTVANSFLLRDNADALHLHEALKYCRTIADPATGGFFKTAAEAAKTRLHPHLYALSLGMVFSADPPIAQKDFDLPVLYLNSLFLIILIYSVYGLGNLLFGRREGLLGAFLVSLSPVIFGPIRLALLEVPLAALVSLTILLLLINNRRHSFRISLLAGAIFGLAQLTKETALLFILPAALFLSLSSSCDGGTRKQKTLNLLVFLAAAVFICAPVYLNPGNKAMYYRIYERFLIANAAGTEPSSPLLFLKAFPQFYLGWIAFFAALPLLISYIGNIRKRQILPAIWVIVPLVTFMLSGHKAVRYLIPAIPALFLIISQEAFTPLFRKIGIYPALLVLVFSVQFGILNFTPLMLKSGYQAYHDDTCGLLTFHHEKNLSSTEKMVEFISQGRHAKNKLRVVALPASSVFEPLSYLFTLKRTDIVFISLFPDKTPPLEEWRKDCASGEYLLYFDADPDKLKSFARLLPPDYREYESAARPFYEFAGEFFLRNDKVYVYKRNGERY